MLVDEDDGEITFCRCPVFASVCNPNLMDDDEHPLLVELASLRQTAARCQASPLPSHHHSPADHM